MTDISGFTAIFNKIVGGRSESQIFDDYLNICICVLSGQKYEEEYLSIIKNYKPEEVNSLCELFAAMVTIMDDNGKGLADCLGQFFQNYITRGRNGQFFTPEHVTDMMAQITIDKTSTGQTIMDPACGSGRMLLSAAKVNRRNYFYGADVDSRCARMTAINLCLNGLTGEVAWMNSLTQEHWGGYDISHDPERMFVPTIRKLAAKEGLLYNAPAFRKDVTQPRPTSSKIITVTQAKLDL